MRDRKAERLALEAYRQAHPRCEVTGCRTLTEHVHHLLAWGMGMKCPAGEEYLLALCMGHHTGQQGIHVLGKVEWLRRLAGRLPEKVLRAYASVGITSAGRFAGLPIQRMERAGNFALDKFAKTC